MPSRSTNKSSKKGTAAGSDLRICFTAGPRRDNQYTPEQFIKLMKNDWPREAHHNSLRWWIRYSGAMLSTVADCKRVTEHNNKIEKADKQAVKADAAMIRCANTECASSQKFSNDVYAGKLKGMSPGDTGGIARCQGVVRCVVKKCAKETVASAKAESNLKNVIQGKKKK